MINKNGSANNISQKKKEKRKKKELKHEPFCLYENSNF